MPLIEREGQQLEEEKPVEEVKISKREAKKLAKKNKKKGGAAEADTPAAEGEAAADGSG